MTQCQVIGCKEEAHWNKYETYTQDYRNKKGVHTERDLFVIPTSLCALHSSVMEMDSNGSSFVIEQSPN